jgi:hypothetical protein
MAALAMKNAIFLMFMVIFLLSQGVHRPTHTNCGGSAENAVRQRTQPASSLLIAGALRL